MLEFKIGNRIEIKDNSFITEFLDTVLLEKIPRLYFSKKLLVQINDENKDYYIGPSESEEGATFVIVSEPYDMLWQNDPFKESFVSIKTVTIVSLKSNVLYRVGVTW